MASKNMGWQAGKGRHRLLHGEVQPHREGQRGTRLWLCIGLDALLGVLFPFLPQIFGVGLLY